MTTDGRVFSCGHGQGGRLGLGSEQTVLTPKLVRFAASGHTPPINCKNVSIARDHSVFLNDSGHVSSV
jgi:inhibitor of Bruton tyrosine kinase